MVRVPEKMGEEALDYRSGYSDGRKSISRDVI